MAHRRNRHLVTMLAHLAKVSPLIGVLGHRQVGKTTLLEGLSDHYVTFDNEQELQSALKNSPKYLTRFKSQGTAIDECQLCPSLFPALKERVRKNKRPGQFFMSGSVRFTSKKTIRESLTGRIMNGELLPLTLSELDQVLLPDMAPRILEISNFRSLNIPQLNQKEFQRRQKLINQYLTHGGLPGACFIKSEKVREQRFRDQLETIFERDLRQVQPTTLTYLEILRFVTALAAIDGEQPSHRDLQRRAAISPVTQKKLLYALEATFVIRHIPIEGDSHGLAVLFEDQGEVYTLAKDTLTADQRWAGLIYRNLREQFMYRVGGSRDFFQYRTRAGVFVPLAIRDHGAVLGIVAARGPVNRTHTAAAHSFMSRYEKSKVIIVTDQNEPKVINDRIAVIPAATLLF